MIIMKTIKCYKLLILAVLALSLERKRSSHHLQGQQSNNQRKHCISFCHYPFLVGWHPFFAPLKKCIHTYPFCFFSRIKQKIKFHYYLKTSLLPHIKFTTAGRFLGTVANSLKLWNGSTNKTCWAGGGATTVMTKIIYS